MSEQIVETKNCKNCGIEFSIRDVDLKFYDKISPVFGGKKYSLPTPSHCPDCRNQRRNAFRNERKLYKRKCDLSGKDIISMYSTDKPYKVYFHNEWWSDKWDATDYARVYDFDKSFFQQFDELMKEVPRFALYNFDNDNADYCNYAPHCKSCYLLFGAIDSEDCYYGNTIVSCQSSVDNTYLFDSEKCFENIDAKKNYNTFYAQSSDECKSCYFVYDCLGCDNCILSRNLRNKSFHVMNQPVSKEEFKKIKEQIFSSKVNIQAYLAKFEQIKKNKAIHKYYNGNNNERTLGNFVYDSKNIYLCKEAYFSEDVSYGVRFMYQKMSYDLSGCGYGENLLECQSSDYGYNNKFCTDSEKCKNSMYLNICNNCEFCFGCIGLKNKQYCILNKQYTQEEYEQLVPEIIEYMSNNKERGEFFPISISPYAYNETISNEAFPMSKDEILDKGWDWKEDEDMVYQAKDLYKPLEISQYQTSVVGEQIALSNIEDLKKGVLLGEKSQKPYKIVGPELEFYIKNNLPIPTKHPDQRHLERISKRSHNKFYERNCDKCNIDLKSIYPADTEERVYCEECYNKEIYG